MKKRYAIAGVVLLLACVLNAGCSGSETTASGVDKGDVSSLVAENNAFALDLYKQLAEKEGNLFFSPFSISSALAMTYAGAREETARQMAEVMHFSLVPGKLHPAFSELTGMFNARGKDYQLSVANALWGQVDYEFLPDFIGITNKYYGAGFKEVDYVRARERARQTINEWVEGKTNGKIRDILQPEDLTALTRLVLTNAIYFKGKWQIQFKPEATKTMPFQVSANERLDVPVDVPMMHQVAKFNYAENDQAQVLELPYAGGDLAMVILLPKPGHELAELESMLRPDLVQSWLSELSVEQVEVFLPRFKLEERFVLNEELQRLGMVDAFDEMKADFSGMTPGPQLYISAVIHKAFVEVNEEGTEAAAATAVVMSGKSVAVARPYLFLADHPFVFAIRDLRSGSTLFMGRLSRPAKSSS